MAATCRSYTLVSRCRHCLLLIWSAIELKSLKRVIAHARSTIDHVSSKWCRSLFIVGHPRRQVADGRETTLVASIDRCRSTAFIRKRRRPTRPESDSAGTFHLTAWKTKRSIWKCAGNYRANNAEQAEKRKTN